MIENNNEVLNGNAQVATNSVSNPAMAPQQPAAVPTQPATQEAAVINEATTVSTLNETEEEKLRKEMDVGEHDIVIEEDFQIDLNVSEVDDSFAAALASGATPEQNNTPVELASEQSGSITF